MDEHRTTMKFPLLRLPLEIRQQIYSLALPSDNVPSWSDDWGYIGGARGCMSLLRVNKQIFDEARKPFYRSTTLTIAIPGQEPHWLGLPPLKFRPYPFTTSIQCTKHCQLTLYSDYDDLKAYISWIKERVRAARVKISQISNLKTLKVSFDCPCTKGRSQASNDEIIQTILSALEPLRQVRVTDKVTFIAAGRSRAYHRERMAFCLAIEPPRNVSDLSDLYIHDETSGGKFDSGRKTGAQYRSPEMAEEPRFQFQPIANRPCQRPACSSYTDVFSGLKAIIEGKTPLDVLPRQQTNYLKK
ncbi:MAG: hypothetical protein Q9170_006538 [Blastenia crenularia]